METKQFSKKDALAFGWETVKKRPVFIIGVWAIFLVLYAGYIIVDFVVFPDQIFTPFDLLFFPAIVFVTIGYIRICLNCIDGEKSSVADLFRHYRLFLPMLGASLLYGLSVMLGLILLIVPGIMVAMARYMYDYLIVDRKMSVSESLKYSAVIMKGHKGDLFVFLLLLIPVNIAGLLALGLGIFVTVPLSMLALTHAYRQILALHEQE